jgi:hypothetical protein
VRRAAVVLAALVAALPAGGAHATELQLAGRASWTPTADGAMCFSLSPGSVVVGTASAHGLVKTGPLVPDDVPDLPDVPDVVPDVVPPITVGISAASTLVADVRPLVSTGGYSSVCVGGTGQTVTGGSATFALDAHGTSADYATVVTCSYRFDGPHCG